MNPQPRSAAHAALEVVKRLRDSGHVAWFAGGCVRDMLLNTQPKDFDVATDAHPRRILELFPSARMVGAKFGVVLVRKFDHDLEVATFRTDGTYSDGRHPDSVVFGSDQEDARRRDFTINGLFYDPLGDRVLDYVGGRADLESRVIRTIGAPENRFAEDHLRMLRAVRFAARLGFTIDPLVAVAIRRLAPTLREISPERVWMELEQMLTGVARTQAWELLTALELTPHLVETWLPTSGELLRIRAALAALPRTPLPAALVLAVLFRTQPASRLEPLCRALRISNRLTATTLWLIRSLRFFEENVVPPLPDLKTLMAGPDWPSLLEMLHADRIAAGTGVAVFEQTRARAAAIAPQDVAPPPLLSGDELGAIGVTPGPKFGEVLKAVYRAQLAEEIQTTEQALELARRLLGA